MEKKQYAVSYFPFFLCMEQIKNKKAVCWATIQDTLYSIHQPVPFKLMRNIAEMIYTRIKNCVLATKMPIKLNELISLARRNKQN